MMDRWVISRLNTLVDYVDRGLDEYKVTETSRAISAFVDELSNWYVRLSRERFWGKGMEGTKKAAFETLYTVLVTLTMGLCPSGVRRFLIFDRSVLFIHSGSSQHEIRVSIAYSRTKVKTLNVWENLPNLTVYCIITGR